MPAPGALVPIVHHLYTVYVHLLYTAEIRFGKGFPVILPNQFLVTRIPKEFIATWPDNVKLKDDSDENLVFPDNYVTGYLR